MQISRRGFIWGSTATLATVSTAARISNLAFAADPLPFGRDTIVVLFLRGACDGLSLVAPCADLNYVTKRPKLRLIGEGTGANVALPIANTLDGILNFRLPRAVDIKSLYDAGKLAIVHACGLKNGSRSHFDAQAYMDRGISVSMSVTTGWITRHLASLGTVGAGPITAFGAGSTLPVSLNGSLEAVSMTDVRSFDFRGTSSRYQDQQRTALQALYAGSSTIQGAGLRTLRTTAAIQAKLPRDLNGAVLPYTPDSDATYPCSPCGL